MTVIRSDKYEEIYKRGEVRNINSHRQVIISVLFFGFVLIRLWLEEGHDVGSSQTLQTSQSTLMELREGAARHRP